jgi:hypothetical protein
MFRIFVSILKAMAGLQTGSLEYVVLKKWLSALRKRFGIPNTSWKIFTVIQVRKEDGKNWCGVPGSGEKQLEGMPTMPWRFLTSTTWWVHPHMPGGEHFQGTKFVGGFEFLVEVTEPLRQSTEDVGSCLLFVLQAQRAVWGRWLT